MKMLSPSLLLNRHGIQKNYLIMTNYLIFSEVKFIDLKRLSFNLASQVSISLLCDNVYQLFIPIFMYSSSFSGISNIGNPSVVLDFVHPNVVQYSSRK